MVTTNNILGSHNTMTYLRPSNWWLWLGHKIVAQCQNKTIEEQFEKGIRCFDLRVYYDKNYDKFFFSHGMIRYDKKYDIHSVVKTINTLARKNKSNVYIRLILEHCENEYYAIKFVSLCKYLVSRKYKYIDFIGGNRKGDWKQLYDFANNIHDCDINQFVSSMAQDARWYEKFIPRLYAMRMNKINKNFADNFINLYDFV